jgi:hypothetical protein
MTPSRKLLAATSLLGVGLFGCTQVIDHTPDGGDAGGNGADANGGMDAGPGQDAGPSDGGGNPDGGPANTGYCNVNGTWELADGGTLMSQAGSCQSVTCSIGCGCLLLGGNPDCLCTGGLPPDGGEVCIQPNCGVVQCEAPCACVDQVNSACWCPTNLDSGTPVCTFGQDHTCNDDTGVSANWGVCNANGTCTCNAGFVSDPSTGKCTPQSVQGSCAGQADSGTFYCDATACAAGTSCASDIICSAGSCAPQLQIPLDGNCHQTCSQTGPACPLGQNCTQIPAAYDCMSPSVQWICCDSDGGCLKH